MCEREGCTCVCECVFSIFFSSGRLCNCVIVCVCVSHAGKQLCRILPSSIHFQCYEINYVNIFKPKYLPVMGSKQKYSIHMLLWAKCDEIMYAITEAY